MYSSTCMKSKKKKMLKRWKKYVVELFPDERESENPAIHKSIKRPESKIGTRQEHDQSRNARWEW